MNKLVSEMILGTDFLCKHKKVTFEFNGPEEPITFAATQSKASKVYKIIEHIWNDAASGDP